MGTPRVGILSVAIPNKRRALANLVRCTGRMPAIPGLRST